MNLRPLSLLALLCLAAAPAPQPAQAPDRPPAQPTRDAIVGYHLAPATGEPIDVRVMLRSGGRAMRVDLPDTSFILVQPLTRQLVMVVPLERTALDLPWSDGPQPLFLVDDAKRYTRKADATIAGQRCTMWEAVADKARSSLCVTTDGVILRHISFDPIGRRNLVEAFAIRFEEAAEVDFEVPPGFDRLVGAPQRAQQ